MCATCSAHQDIVKGYDQQVRVCNMCHDTFQQQSNSESTQETLNRQEDGANGGPAHQDNAPDMPTFNQSYKLVPNDLMYNQTVRRQFYYERTPNTALCLSLADLLVQKQQAAGVILDCCHTVSAQLVPDTMGRVNEELDHHFVIGCVDLKWNLVL